MKVGLVSWGFDTVDGVGRCVVESSTRLASSYDVHVFAAAADHPAPPGVTLHRIPVQMRRRYPAEIEYLIKVNAAVKKANCDLIHCHIPAMMLADIVTCHSMAPSILKCQDISMRVRLPYLIQAMLYGYHFRNKNTLIAAVSNRLRQEAANHYHRDAESMVVISNGVDLTRFHPKTVRAGRNELRERLGFRDSHFVFLLIGSTLRLKGAHFAAETVARLPDQAVLLVVGNGNPSELPDENGVLSGLLQSGRAVFARPDGNIANYYGVGDALLFPSQYESFGLVVLEAMACGLPVITARTVGFGDESIEDGKNGFIVEMPGDVDGLAERARILLENPKIVMNMRVKARNAAEEYSWDHHVAQTKSVYEHVMDSRKGKTHRRANIFKYGSERETSK